MCCVNREDFRVFQTSRPKFAMSLWVVASPTRKDRHLQYLTVTKAAGQGRIASALAMSFVVLLELVTGHRPSGYCEPESPPAI